jgi:hypothetical protein
VFLRTRAPSFADVDVRTEGIRASGRERRAVAVAAEDAIRGGRKQREVVASGGIEGASFLGRPLRDNSGWRHTEIRDGFRGLKVAIGRTTVANMAGAGIEPALRAPATRTSSTSTAAPAVEVA